MSSIQVIRLGDRTHTHNSTQCLFFLQETAEDDCVIVLVGNKTDLCDDDEQRPVKYKDGAKLADVNLQTQEKKLICSFSFRIGI